MPLTCPYCREAIAETSLAECPACNTPHHHDCWNENGGCTVFGCENAPSDDPKIAVSVGEVGGSTIVSGKQPASYLVHRNGQQFGPYTMQQLQGYSAEGSISPSDLVWGQGMAEWLPLSHFLVGRQPPPLPSRLPATVNYPHQISNGGNGRSIFLYIPIVRLVAMSLLTFGIYEIYWIYKNWRFLKERDRLSIQPFWRGVFAVWFIRSLLKAIKEDKETNRICPARFNAGGLAAAWITLSLIGYFLGRSNETAVSVLGTVITLPAVVFLLPVQKYINEVNESVSPKPQFNAWSTGHIVCIILGVITWLLIIVGLNA